MASTAADTGHLAPAGLRALDESLANLVRQGVVDYQEAYLKASVPTEFDAIVKEGMPGDAELPPPPTEIFTPYAEAEKA